MDKQYVNQKQYVFFGLDSSQKGQIDGQNRRKWFIYVQAIQVLFWTHLGRWLDTLSLAPTKGIG